MTFLCNTFFPLDRIPTAIKAVIDVLPLTHASGLLRSMAYGSAPNLWSVLILALYALVFMVLANAVINRRKNI